MSRGSSRRTSLAPAARPKPPSDRRPQSSAVRLEPRAAPVDERAMSVAAKLAQKSFDDASVHSFFLPWKKIHKNRQTWKEKRTMSWDDVTCTLCLVHKPLPGAPTPP